MTFLFVSIYWWGVAPFTRGLHCIANWYPQNFADVKLKDQFFFKKMGQPWPFFVYFQSFQSNIKFFYNKYMWKMSIQYMVPGFEPTTFRMWVSSHNHETRAPALKTSLLFYRQDYSSFFLNVCTDFGVNGCLLFLSIFDLQLCPKVQILA